MFDIRLRLAEPNGTPGRVLEAEQIVFAWVESGTARLTFSVSENVAGSIDTPQVIAVEYSTGGPYKAPRNNLFIATEDSSDATDPSGMKSFTAVGYVGWLLSRLPVWHQDGDTDNTREYVSRTPGEIMRHILEHGKTGLGWAPSLGFGFNQAVDGLGNPWPSRVSQSYPLFTTYASRVLQTLAEQGYLQWWADGMVLQLIHPEAQGLAKVVLGGPGFTRAPARSEFDPITDLVVQYDQGWTFFPNGGADTRFGRVFQTMSQQGVPTRAAAESNAQPALTAGRALQAEHSFDWVTPGWTPAPLAPEPTPIPFEDLNVGDFVVARTRRGKRISRVLGMTIEKRDGRITARATVGDKMLSHAAKLARRTAAVSVGTIIGGSGAATPPAPSPPSTAPMSPDGVRAESNTASWTADGVPLSRVTIAWNAVAQGVDLSRVDVETYEVWSREPSAQPALTTRTPSLSTTIDTWTPGVQRLVKVRARSRAGVWSDWSAEISVTPLYPASIVPKAPTGLTAASNTGAFASDGTATSTVRVTWAAVTASTDDTPVDVSAYRAELEDGQVWVPLTESATREAIFTVPSGRARRVRVRARSALGVWGDPSTPLSVTGANPAQTTTAATAPTLTTGMGLVMAVWDGRLVGNITPPASFNLLYAETAPASTGPWTRAAGSPTRTAGQVATVRGAAGADVFVRFVWLDTLGRVANASAVASIKVVSVIGADIDKAITDALDKAGRDATAAGQTAEKAVQDALDARGAATTAQTTAEAARDSAIAAARNAENKVANGSFERGTEGWEVSGLTLDPTGGREGTAALVTTGSGTALQPAVIVTPGQRWRMEFWYRTDGAQAGAVLNGGLRLQRWNGTSWTDSGITTTTAVADWTRQAVEYVIPDGVTRIRTRLAWSYTGGARLWFDDVRLTDVTQIVALEVAAQAAQSKAEKAERDAAAAQSKADQAASVASAAQGTANSAAYAAAAAQTRADAAVTNAKTAQDAADAAAARSAALLASAENKIADPSMSQGQWAPGGGWALSNKGRTDTSSLVATGTPTTRTTAVLRPPGASGGMYLPVEPGQVLEIGGWYQVDTAWDGTPSNSKLRPANQSGQLVGPNLGIPSNTVRDQWVRISGRYTVPASGVTGIGLNVVSDHTNGLAWWDDFFLRDITAAVKAETDAKAAADAAVAAKSAADAAAAAAADALAKAGSAQSTADTALASASGRNALFHDVTGPSGQGTRVGDIWQQWSSMAVNGRLLATWRWSGAAWVKTLLDETYLPLVNIGAGTYGSLRGDRLVANTVSTKTLLVGDFTNLIEDEDFLADIGLTWARRTGATTASSYVTTTGLPGKTWKLDGVGTEVSVTTVNESPVDPGAKYRLKLRAQVQLTGSLPIGHVRAFWFKEDGAASATAWTSAFQLAPAGWANYSTELTAPADAAYLKLVFIHGNNCTGGSWWFGRVSLRPMATGDMIVDGAITALKLNVSEIWAADAWLDRMRSGVVETSMLVAGFGQNLDIAANGAITLIAGQAAEQAGKLADAQSQIAGVAGQVNTLGGQVGEVRSNASAAATAAAAAQAAAAAAQAAADGLSAYVRIDGTGVEIGSPGAATSVKITPSSMTFNVNGVAGAYLDAGQFIAPRFVGEEVDLANVKIQKQANRTVVKVI